MRTTLCTVVVAAAALNIHAEPPEGPRHRVTVGAVAGINGSVSFRSTDAARPAVVRPNPAGGVDRGYDDGFVRQDAGGPAAAETWYWGYQQAAQAAGDAVAMHALTGRTGASFDERTDDPQLGAELAYAHRLVDINGAVIGLEIGAAWTGFNVADRGSAATLLARQTDTFSLGGLMPPAAPYAGTFDGPGPLLPREPATSVTAPGTLAGTRELDADVWGLRLGPVLELPMGDLLAVQLSGGLAVSWVDAELSYRETVTFASGPALHLSGRASEDDWLFGGYLRGQLTGQITGRCGAYVAVQYLVMEDLEVAGPERAADVELGGTVQVSAGLVFTF